MGIRKKWQKLDVTVLLVNIAIYYICQTEKPEVEV